MKHKKYRKMLDEYDRRMREFFDVPDDEQEEEPEYSDIPKKHKHKKKGNPSLFVNEPDSDQDDDDVPQWYRRYIGHLADPDSSDDEEEIDSKKLTKKEREMFRVEQVREDSKRDVLMVEQKPFIAEYLKQIKEGKNPFKLKKKKLTEAEYEIYKSFGEPNLDQVDEYLNWITPAIRHDLLAILHAGMDNQSKANILEDELSYLGFRIISSGTNITVMENPVYPGVVFKFALDECGIADNFNDEILQYRIPHFAKVFARETLGLISVQQRYVWMDSNRMTDFRDEIYELLEELKEKYIVADMSPKRFLNYGVDRNGEFVIIDGSDLYPLNYIPDPIRCKNLVGWDPDKEESIKCGGKLEYTDDFMWLKCKKCGKEINPLEARPKRDATGYTDELDNGISFINMDDGYTLDELKRIECLQLKVARELRKRYPNDWHDVSVDELTDEIPIPDAEEEHKIEVPDRTVCDIELKDEAPAISDEDMAEHDSSTDEEYDGEYLDEYRINMTISMLKMHGFQCRNHHDTACWILEILHMMEDDKIESVEFNEDDAPDVKVATEFINQFYNEQVIYDEDACSVYPDEDDDDYDPDADDDDEDEELEYDEDDNDEDEEGHSENSVIVEGSVPATGMDPEETDMDDLRIRRSLFTPPPQKEHDDEHEPHMFDTKFLDEAWEESYAQPGVRTSEVSNDMDNSPIQFLLQESQYGRDLVICFDKNIDWTAWDEHGTNFCLSTDGGKSVIYLFGKDLFAKFCKMALTNQKDLSKDGPKPEIERDIDIDLSR